MAAFGFGYFLYRRGVRAGAGQAANTSGSGKLRPGDACEHSDDGDDGDCQVNAGDSQLAWAERGGAGQVGNSGSITGSATTAAAVGDRPSGAAHQPVRFVGADSSAPPQAVVEVPLWGSRLPLHAVQE